MPTIPENFSLNDLEEAYSQIDPEPDFIIVSPKVYTAIKSKFQAQQRFSVVTPNGPIGFKFNKSTITTDRYAPGRAVGIEFEDDFDEFCEWVKEVRENAASE